MPNAWSGYRLRRPRSSGPVAGWVILEELRGIAHCRARSTEHSCTTCAEPPCALADRGPRRLDRIGGDGHQRRVGDRAEPRPVVVLDPQWTVGPRHHLVLPVGGPPHRGLARRRSSGATGAAHHAVGVADPHRLGCTPVPRATPVQPGHLQLHRSGVVGPPWAQSLLGPAQSAGSRSAALVDRQRVAIDSLALRPAVRGGGQRRSRRGRELVGGAGAGLSGTRAGGRGSDHGLIATTGPSSGHGPRHRPLAGRPQPAGLVQFHSVGAQRRAR